MIYAAIVARWPVPVPDMARHVYPWDWATYPSLG
jgi:hypothetical protein